MAMTMRARGLALVGLVFGLLLCGAHAQDQVGTGLLLKDEAHISESTVTIKNYPPELLAQLVAAADKLEAFSELERARLEEKIEQLSHEIGIRRPAVRNFLRDLGEQEVPLERLQEKLAEIADRHRELLERLAVLDPEMDPAIAALVEEARREIEAGNHDRADALLARAEEAELATARQAQELAQQAAEAADRRFLRAAERRAERGELSLTRLAYRDAAAHFKAAFELAPSSEHDVRGDYLFRNASALYEYGDLKGRNAPLREAIKGYKAALEEWTRERAPLDWATTQNNLGNALLGLGERESGTERLEAAVAAYRSALEFRTRERVPLAWAMTQNNLGSALATLGARESGTGRLDAAVAAYRSALEEITRERVPLDWAMTQNNLGNVLSMLGAREGGTERLEAAVAAYRRALEEWTRERVPLDWAMTQNNLGNAIATLGERKRDPTLLRAALDAMRQSFDVYIKDAGLTQYEAYFADRIARIEEVLAGLED